MDAIVTIDRTAWPAVDCIDAIVTIDRFNRVNGLTGRGLRDRTPDTV